MINKDTILEETLDLSQLINILARHWYWFVISLALALPAAFTANKLITPLYKVNAKILVSEQGSSFMDPLSLLGGGIMTSTFKVKNQIQILQSYALINLATKNLPLEATWMESNGFTNKLLYPPPFRTEIISLDPRLYNRTFTLTVGVNGSIELYSNSDKAKNLEAITLKGTIGQEVILPNLLNLRFTSIVGTIKEKTKYQVVFNSPAALANYFSNIDFTEDKYSTVIKLSFQDPSPQRAVDYLNSLTTSYLEREVVKKNLIAVNTIKFIENQLEIVSDSLAVSEKSLETFRRKNQATNLSIETQKAYETLGTIEKEKAFVKVNLNYFEYLKKQITLNEDLQKLVVPSSIGINDELLNKLVLDLMLLYSERAEIQINSKKDNPLTSAIDKKIESGRRNIVETLDGLIYSTNISLKNLEERLTRYQVIVSSIPEKERELLSFQRKFKLNDEIYTFLLTKRSELQISAASNFPENEILDPPSLEQVVKVSPNGKFNFLIALFLGLAIPAGLIFLKYELVNKLEDAQQLAKISQYPHAGDVVHTDEIAFILNENLNSRIADSFRGLRTNLRFLMVEGGTKVILVTSSVSGEGKSFISKNLAASFALANKKTLLVHLDLRKPADFSNFGIENNEGLSSFLSGVSTFESIILKTKFANLDLIPSGPIPPNPTELIDSAKAEEMFKSLRNQYDIIIVDSPPVGLVADPLVLASFSDHILFVVRYRTSRIRLIKQTLYDLTQKGIKKISIVANDVTLRSFGYGYYGYGYHYGYAYGEKKKSRFKKFFGKN
ncbi:polysaccharide biosynthesis tyrosine autokinase [Williamwhitmania taraxaci]|uniref:non-specific protein-tyrosine kinase n=1 Tax=Williamwhitmania taraxaci TaxID=1640674 RepID=A0A1G6N0Q7_9BACT|nr:tyrosine-protein kinase [Williamwhitmania taraxaci]SDC61027.1 capsular exopolysaccharide family [Williamwhitmania taraxaci]